MTTASKLYFIHCMSPVHVGAGQGVGAIEMPMMKEKTTGWPLIPGSSVKGSTRDFYESRGEEGSWIGAAFGLPASQGEESNKGNAGALVWSDSRLLAFPVASMTGTFAYVSCPLALKRMQRDAEAGGIALPPIPFDRLANHLAAGDGEADRAVIAYGIPSELVWHKKQIDSIELDEFVFHAEREPELDAWLSAVGDHMFSDLLSRDMFMSRFVIVSDEAFQYFTEMCCEIVPRIRIRSTSKTVEVGGLWLEEYIPTEAILYGIVWCDRMYAMSAGLSKRDLLQHLQEDLLLQIGGNATVGKGRVRFSFSKEVAAQR